MSHIVTCRDLRGSIYGSSFSQNIAVMSLLRPPPLFSPPELGTSSFPTPPFSSPTRSCLWRVVQSLSSFFSSRLLSSDLGVGWLNLLRGNPANKHAWLHRRISVSQLNLLRSRPSPCSVCRPVVFPRQPVEPTWVVGEDLKEQNGIRA